MSQANNSQSHRSASKKRGENPKPRSSAFANRRTLNKRVIQPPQHDENKYLDWENKIDLDRLNYIYEQWAKLEDNLSGVLKVKNIKAKNLELRTKICFWQENQDEIKEKHSKDLEREKQVNAIL
jgi:hypothetical protein